MIISLLQNKNENEYDSTVTKLLGNDTVNWWMKNPREGQDGIVYFWINTFSFKKKSNEILRKRNVSLWWGVWIGHLVHVAILTPHWGGFIANSLCRWYALHHGGRFFLQRKALGLHWYLNPVIFSTTHTQLCLSHLCLYDKK